jgi:ribosomal protein S18 acetylase RimI-like enzyme
MSDFQQPFPLPASLLETAADIMVNAFREDVVYNHLFPDSQSMPKLLRRHLKSLLIYGMACGEVYIVPEKNGAACWLPSWQPASTWRGLVRSRFAVPRARATFSPETIRRMKIFKRFNDEVKMRTVPERHLFLDLLAVQPNCQGQGVGGKLLQSRLAKCDLEQLPCYLETETEGNVRFYQRYGFNVVNKGQVPDSDLTIWAMLRPPQ